MTKMTGKISKFVESAIENVDCAMLNAFEDNSQSILTELGITEKVSLIKDETACLNGVMAIVPANWNADGEMLNSTQIFYNPSTIVLTISQTVGVGALFNKRFIYDFCHVVLRHELRHVYQTWYKKDLFNRAEIAAYTKKAVKTNHGKRPEEADANDYASKGDINGLMVKLMIATQTINPVKLKVLSARLAFEYRIVSAVAQQAIEYAISVWAIYKLGKKVAKGVNSIRHDKRN